MTEPEYRASLEWELGIFPADLRDWYEERAAVLQYCEGLDRKTAERLAWVQTVKKKRDQ